MHPFRREGQEGHSELTRFKLKLNVDEEPEHRQLWGKTILHEFRKFKDPEMERHYGHTEQIAITCTTRLVL